MKRTCVIMPESLEAKAKKAAKKRGVSFSQFVRQATESELARAGEDPFFIEPLRFDVDIPDDAAVRTEKYQRAPRKGRR